MEKLLTREDRISKTIINSRKFRKTRDLGLPIGDLIKVVDISEDNLDLCFNVYDIAYRRGYNKALKELKAKAESEAVTND